MYEHKHALRQLCMLAGKTELRKTHQMVVFINVIFGEGVEVSGEKAE